MSARSPDPKRAPARSSRGVLVLAVAIPLVLLVAYLASQRDDGDHARADVAPRPAREEQVEEAHERPAPSIAIPDAGPLVHEHAHEHEEEGEESGWSDPSTFPLPPTADPTAPAPAPRERPTPELMAQEDFVARRERALALLDETSSRLERELADQQRTGDDEAARRTRVRLQRMETLRAERVDELERARRGELQPDPDLLPAGPRPDRPVADPHPEPGE